MPELPEVETIRRELEPWVVGRRFLAIELSDPTVVVSPAPGRFKQGLLGQKIVGLGRRGKYLIFRLHNGKNFLVHFRMTGVLLLDQADNYARAIFHLSDGTRLVFSDRRRLGVMRLAEEGEGLDKLGPEPLEADFIPQVLAQLLKKRSAPIKAVLLDQSFLAGLGNMYADEALFSARLHPLKPAKDLTPKEVARLHRAIQGVLRAAIASQGASVDTYRLPDGRTGQAQFLFRVAHRGGQACPVCASPIQRLGIRGRGSYFCPQCQRLSDLTP